MPLTPEQARMLAVSVLEEEGGEEPPSSPAGGPPTPDRIGDCTIRRVIGSGGMSTVFEARQDHPHRVVAVKLMRPGRYGHNLMRRFQFEAEILGRLHHPSIAQVYASGWHEEAGTSVPYFTMEFVPEARPITIFAREQGLDLRRRVELLCTVCDAVHYGHQKGVIHRDLKPANILVDDQGLPKVIDFGIARVTDSDLMVTTLQTGVGELVGTLPYMSPEQCSGIPDSVDVRTDVYALGTVLYELICDRLPLDLSDSTLPSAVRMIQEQPPPSPRQASPRIGGRLEAIVLKAIEKEPARRYQSAAQLAEDLRRFLRGEPIEARRSGPWAGVVRWTLRHPIAATSAACAAILALTILMTWTSVWVLNRRPHEVWVSADAEEVRLLAVSGRVIESWRLGTAGAARLAGLVDRPDGRGQLVVLGINRSDDADLASSLVAFDLSGSLETPLWRARVEPADLRPDLTGPGVGTIGWGLAMAELLDVFPDHPGDEIVATWQYADRSITIVGIYDLRGQALDEFWHDGTLCSVHLLEEPRRLIFGGHNSEADWADRGHPEVRSVHPLIVFSVVPRAGRRMGLVSPSPVLDPSDVPWYRALLPAEASDVFRPPMIREPHRDEDEARTFRVEMTYQENRDAVLSLLLDGAAQELGRDLPDPYRTGPALPPHERFRLGDLPPIVGRSAPPEPSRPSEAP